MPRSVVPTTSCAPAATAAASSSGRRLAGARAKGSRSTSAAMATSAISSRACSAVAAAQRGQPRARRGQDVQARVEIDLQTAFDGGRTRVSLHDGRGEERVLEVKIPAGIQPGQVIRLAGQGQAGSGGGPKGDLLLEVGIRDDARFKLDGRDVLHVLPLSPWEAALGATVPVPTLAGTVELRVPAGSQSGRKLRLKGRGLPGAHPGDQLVELSIRAPAADTDKQRSAWEALRKQYADYDPRR